MIKSFKNLRLKIMFNYFNDFSCSVSEVKKISDVLKSGGNIYCSHNFSPQGGSRGPKEAAVVIKTAARRQQCP